MNDFIFNLEEQFQPYLPNGYYTFVGPANEEHLGYFTNAVNIVAPVHNAIKAINNTLAQRNIVRQMISALYHDADLDLYVVEGTSPNGIIYTRANDFCRRLGIKFRYKDSLI